MIKKFIFIFIFFSFIFLCFSNNILAQTTQETNPKPQTVTLSNPLGAGATPQTVIGKVISQVLGIVGAVALLMFIYGGLTWMTAMGNEQSIKKGKDILMWSSIGLIVIFTSYALVRFVLQAIGA